MGCDRFASHQFVCNHPDPVFRCWMQDGCRLDICDRCIFEPKSPYHAKDLTNLTLNYPTRLGERSQWSEAQTLINLLRLAGRFTSRYD